MVSFHLNRPLSLNALSIDQVLALDEQLRVLKSDSSCRGILFTGAGDRAFCAGGDVLHLAQNSSEWNRRWFSAEFLLNSYIASFGKPVVSVWKGIVMGGGVGLSIYGSHRIATDTTMFAMPETAIGFFPDVGGSYFLSHLVRQPGLGLYLGMTGHRLLGYDTVIAGLATHFVPLDKLDAFVTGLSTASDISLWIFKFGVDYADQGPKTLSVDFLKSVAIYFDGFDTFESFFDHLKKGASDRDLFAEKTLHSIRGKCPLTVRVWFESFQMGKKQSLPGCLAREYNMCIQATEVDVDNFREGVRAVLIDKGKGDPPKYLPASIEETTQEQVDKILESKAGGDLLPFILKNERMYN